MSYSSLNLVQLQRKPEIKRLSCCLFHMTYAANYHAAFFISLVNAAVCGLS